MKDVFIVEPVRTAIGGFGGMFKNMMGSDLAVPPVKACIEQAGIDPGDLDDVIFGNCFMRSDDINIARVILLKAGIPWHVPGVTVQRQCSSSMQAAVYAAQQIQTGCMEMILVGGVEAMSQTPYMLKDVRWGKRMQHGEMTDCLWEGLSDPNTGMIMGMTAENLAQKHDISREEQDVIALRSNLNAAKATEDGRFAEEIVPVVVKTRRGEKIFDKDEHFRGDITMEDLTKLRPVFKKDGTVTAANSSGINDGAAAALICSEDAVKKHGLRPMARLVDHAVAAVEPELMGYGPVPATRKALDRAGMTLADIDLIELNEAFAAQYLACEKLLELNRDITNVNGSGVGLGHPVGATGLRIVVSLLHEMRRRGVSKGLASLCVGGGMGKTTIWEMV